MQGPSSFTNNTGGSTVTTATPLSYSNLGGTGLLTLNNSTSPTDTLMYQGTSGNDTFNVAVVGGATRWSW